MSWDDLARLVRDQAPALHAAFLPPVGVPMTGLPPDLADWWRVFGGVSRSALGDDSPLIPLCWHPLDAESAHRRREETRIPIAVDSHGGDELLYVSLADGSVFSDDAPEWPSVTAMLDHVQRMFERNDDPVYRLLRHEDGHINWDTRPTLTPGLTTGSVACTTGLADRTQESVSDTCQGAPAGAGLHVVVDA